MTGDQVYLKHILDAIERIESYPDLKTQVQAILQELSGGDES
ncbi:MAG: hypothetical protein JMDDDDMK_01725 [Acidobacteria bacterium]|nr:hypothetical protein [Acidobacteriota bacterium]